MLSISEEKVGGNLKGFEVCDVVKSFLLSIGSLIKLTSFERVTNVKNIYVEFRKIKTPKFEKRPQDINVVRPKNGETCSGQNVQWCLQ